MKFREYLKEDKMWADELSNTIAKNTAMRPDFVKKWVIKYKLDNYETGNSLMVKYNKSKKWTELMKIILNDKKPK